MSEIVIPSSDCSPYQFGASLAAWNDQLLIGSPYRYYAARQNEGIPPPTTALFTRTADRWTLTQLLTASDPIAADGFGRSVALGGSFAIIGAPGHENGDGPVHDFERTEGATFHLSATLPPPGRPPLDDVFAEYGAAIACDDQTLIVAAPLESNGDLASESCGVVYVFDRRARSNRLLATHYGTQPRESFGSAVALSGDLLVVGAAGSYSNEQLPGAAYVFSREASGQWRELCRVCGHIPGEEFGAAVAIDGRLFAVAAPGRSDLERPVGARVDLFKLGANGCEQIATIQEDPGFGRALALLGDRLAVGQPECDAPDGTAQTGRVGLFRVTHLGVITREAWLVATRSGEYARLGSAVALGPDYVAAGAAGLGEDDDGSGYVITRSF
jgi:FG-GAP repeat